jgi:hypothetical protein
MEYLLLLVPQAHGKCGVAAATIAAEKGEVRPHPKSLDVCRAKQVRVPHRGKPIHAVH